MNRVLMPMHKKAVNLANSTEKGSGVCDCTRRRCRRDSGHDTSHTAEGIHALSRQKDQSVPGPMMAWVVLPLVAKNFAVIGSKMSRIENLQSGRWLRL